MVRRRGMIGAAIVPDSHVVDVLPAQPDVQVVVLDHQVDEALEEVVALVPGEAVDARDVVADGEDRVPPGDGVGPDHGVRRLEDDADVLGGPARPGEHGQVVGRGGLREVGVGAVRGEGAQEGAQRRRDAVVQLVSRCPECVFAIERLAFARE